MRDLLVVALGGAAGAICRYLFGLWAVARWGGTFPFGTLAINVSGCLALGFFGSLVLDRTWLLPPEWRLFVAVGFLGAYTTFSAFGLETLRLMETGATGAAVLYVGGSVGAGLLATWLGSILARMLA